MRKNIALLLVCALLMSCVSALAETEIIVFAAASLTETMNTIAGLYEAENPDVKITCNFDSSGTLKRQIQEGADCDLFISAAQRQMDQMDITADPGVNIEGLDIVDPETRVNLLENRVILAVPEGNPKGIQTFDQLAELLKDGEILLAIGNSDVPVGQYTRKIFDYYGIDEAAIADKLTYGSNVKEVTTQVSEYSVDCGIIYSTDAFSAGLTAMDEATAEMCGGQVIYPAAVLKTAKHAEAAGAFLNYLQTGTASSVYASVGFIPIAGAGAELPA